MPALGDPRFEYLLRLGDDALVLGQRLSEWCGQGASRVRPMPAAELVRVLMDEYVEARRTLA